MVLHPSLAVIMFLKLCQFQRGKNVFLSYVFLITSQTFFHFFLLDTCLSSFPFFKQTTARQS